MDIVSAIFAPFLRALQRFFCWLIVKFLDLLQTFLDWLFPLLPIEVMEAGAELYTWVHWADKWVPVEYGITLIVSLFNLRIAVATIKIIRRFLPF